MASDPARAVERPYAQAVRRELEARAKARAAEAAAREAREAEERVAREAEAAAREAREAARRASPEPEALAERLWRGRVEGARQGRHQSGPTPYGYRRAEGGRHVGLLVPHPVEGPIVRTIFLEYLRRRSMKRVVQMLNLEMRVKTQRGREWSRAGVAWILANGTYAGRVHFGAVRVMGRHPALVAPIIWNKVQKRIRENTKKGGRRAGVREETGAATDAG